MEANLVNNAYGYTDSKGNFVDQSDRTGYGMSMTWNGLKTDPENGVVVNLNTAYLMLIMRKISLPGLTRCGNVSSWVISTRTIRLMNSAV